MNWTQALVALAKRLPFQDDPLKMVAVPLAAFFVLAISWRIFVIIVDGLSMTRSNKALHEAQAKVAHLLRR